MDAQKRAFYEDRNYRRQFAPLSSRHRLVLDMFAKYCPERVDKVLDIGCYDGAFSILIGTRLSANEVFGVDISESNVAEAQAKGCRAVVCDIDSSRLPFDDASFQAIHAGDIIEHLYNPDALLTEIHRLLASAGICILTTPNLAALANRIALLLGYQPFPVGTSLEHDPGKLLLSNALLLGGHIRVFTLRALKELLLIHGFKVLRTEGMAMSTGGGRALVKLYRAFERPILGNTLYRLFPSFAWDLLFVLQRG